MSDNKIYNWGIIGCGKISSDWCNVLLSNPRCNILGCAARKKSSALKFAKKFDIPIENTYDCYEELCKQKNIDIIYIGTLHPNHLSSSLYALNNNKHVLCEKPVTMNNQELNEVLDCAKKSGCFYMEGMWTRFFPATRCAMNWLKSGKIGNLITANCSFGVNMPSDVPRLWDNKLGGGSILDIGVYTVSAMVMLFGSLLPKEIISSGILTNNNIDSSFQSILKYNNKQYGLISSTFYGNTFEELNIIGNKGKIKIHNRFHAPTKVSLYKNNNDDKIITKEFKLPNNYKYKMNFINSEGFCYQLNEVIKCLDDGRIESPLLTWKETQISMMIMDKIRSQIGLKYDADNFIKAKL